MIDIKYTAFGKARSISVPWKVVGNAMVAKRMAQSVEGSYVRIEDVENPMLIAEYWRSLTDEQKQKISNFIAAGL